MHFTDAEVGLYIRLLCVQWSTGKIPCDNHELSSYGKGDTKIDRVLTKFEVGKDGFLRNRRMEIERKKQENYRKSRADNGKKGGRPTKACGKHMVLKTKAQESSPSPTPSPIPVQREVQRDIDAFPEILNTDEFKSAWNRWHDHLKQKRKPATIHARDLQLHTLSKMGVERAIETINHSIEHNWQGLYEPGQKVNGQPQAKANKPFQFRSGVPFSQMTPEEQEEFSKLT